jgi:manganese transport protein
MTIGPLRLMREMGPAWLGSAIAAGPATMASVIVAGLVFGFPLFWVVVLSAVFGAFSVFLAMRLSLHAGGPLIALVKERLGGHWAWFLTANVLLAAGLAQLVILRTVAMVTDTVIVAGGGPQLGVKVWGLLLAVLLAAGLATGGYRFAERAAKLLVALVVLAFLASLFVIPWDWRAAVHVFTPRFPAGAAGALTVAAVLGGAIHIALISMQGYTMRARGWSAQHYALAKKDIFWSMGIAFGIYSAAIFLVVAAVLHGRTPAGPPHLWASIALEPLAGPLAKWLFLFGLWGAAVTTLGGNAFVPTYALADRLGWGTTVEDKRFRMLLVAFALAAAAGVFIGGTLFDPLRLVVAFGLLASPFVLLLVLVLLNDKRVVPRRPSPLINRLAMVMILITTAVAGNNVVGMVRDYLAKSAAGTVTAFDPVVVGLVLIMASANLLAVLFLGARAVDLHRQGTIAPLEPSTP